MYVKTLIAGNKQKGFTLIELSIVLVIIGLIIGGVLVGRDLITASQIRAQITQIEQYSTAVNTFKLKYNALPGDMKASDVLAAGFTTIPTRVGTRAQGDGNGILEGIYSGGVRRCLIHGETAWFWVDLSANAGLIDGSFNSTTATPSVDDVNWFANSTPSISRIVPPARIGQGNFISVYSFGPDSHHFIISKIVQIAGAGNPMNGSGVLGLTVQQAYNIDNKIDDGVPQTGRVMARYVEWNLQTFALSWAAAGNVEGASSTAATPASATTCYDNGNVASATQQYSLSTNSGNGFNCALSVKFQ